MESTVREIVSDELQRFKRSALSGRSEIQTSTANVDEDLLWEYDGLHTASQFECEEVMLELQRMFYEDIMMNRTHRGISTLILCLNSIAFFQFCSSLALLYASSVEAIFIKHIYQANSIQKQTYSME